MLDTLLNERYRIDFELGRGGMGVIYRAQDILLDRAVAVKILSTSGMGTEGRSRLLHEARAAAQLNHPNIVNVYDAGEADHSPYIVMELVEGESLHERPPQTLKEIIRITCQVCAALEHAHSHGIIHRDLKPENILIARDGTTKLTDFGLARSVASRLSQEGALVGTVFYLAPELALGQPFDGRADLYALGVILYELTTGRLPFVDNDPLAVISQHLHAPAVPPRTFRQDLPPALEAIILTLLAKNPDERFVGASEVATALAQVSATPESTILAQPAGAIDTVLLLEQLGRGRLAGRRTELGQLRELWAHVQHGHSHLALISGEPGIGKTRLAHEVIVFAQLNGGTVLRGGCYEYEATTPYLPIIEAIRAWVHNQDETVLHSRLGPLAPELAKLAPEIESKLGPLAPNPPLPANEERLRLFDSVARFMHGLSSEHGLLLFLDDLHWADQGTLTLLHYLLRTLRNERLLVLGAYREVELDRAHPFAASLVEWTRERLATRLALGRLSPEDVGALLEALFGQANISQEFVAAIYRETEGNPFFIEEVVKSLIEQGQIYREEGRWGRREIEELTIPQSIKEAIGRRLERLPSLCLDMLHTASTLGKKFIFRELAAASGIGEDELLDALDAASQAQLIQAVNGDAFTFTHDKIREVLYEEMNPIRRRRMHQRIGECLERLYGLSIQSNYPETCSPEGSDLHVQDLAHHFMESGDLHRGLHYCMWAAEKAACLYAHDEALNYYQRAAECADALHASDQLPTILEATGQVYYNRGEYQTAAEYFQRALDLVLEPAKRAELKTLVGVTYAYIADERGLEFLQAALEELDPATQTNPLAMAFAMLGRFYHYQAQWGRAVEYLERARQLAEPLDDPLTLNTIYICLSGAYQQMGRIQDSIAWAQKNIELGERQNYPHAVAVGYEFLAEDAFAVGHWHEALTYAQRDREIGEKIGSLARVAWAEASRAYASHGLGDLESARDAARSALEISEQIGDARLSVFIRTRQALILWDLGEDQAAEDSIARAVAHTVESGQAQLKNWCMGAQCYLAFQQGDWDRMLEIANQWESQSGIRPHEWLICANLGLGRLDRISQLIKEVKATSRAEEPLEYQANTWQVQGWAYTVLGSYAEAAEVLDQAVAAFETLDSRLSLARTLSLRGRLKYSLGDRDAAQRDLACAKEIFIRCGAKHDIERTQEYLIGMEPHS